MQQQAFDLKKLNQQVEAKDIDFRVQSINKGGYATVLAYKDARYDMRILDEVVGPENWQKDYKLIDENLYCGISIKVNGEWVTKWDVGTESNTEKEKGQASDAQKRAGFAWGIGRELYDFPAISVKLNPDEFTVEGSKVTATWKLNVRQWHWEVLHETDHIRVRSFDTSGDLRFDSHPSRPSVPNAPSAPRPPAQKQPSPEGRQPEQSPASPQDGPKASDTFQQAIDYIKKEKSQAAYDKVIEKYGASFSDAQKKALSKFVPSK